MGSFGSANDVDAEQRKSKFGFVYPRLQLKFLMLIFLNSLGLITFTYITFKYIYSHQIQDFIENTTLPQDQIQGVMNSIEYIVGYWGLISVLFSVMMLSFGLFFTRRVAGPIYHISKALLDYFDGHKDRRINLRKGDEFIHIESLINRLLDTLEKISQNKKSEDKKN